jgi:hypothetical protein
MEDPLQGLVDGISKWKKDTIYIEQPHFSHQTGSFGAGPYLQSRNQSLALDLRSTEI